MARGASGVEPTAQGQQAWCDLVASYTAGGSGFLEACTPGYYNNEGAPRGGNSFLGAYTAGVYAFAQLLEEWRAAGNLEGLELAIGEQ
jgi:cyclohexanone monooxygenase